MDTNLQQEFDLIRKMIYAGNYSDAEESLNNIEKLEILSAKNLLEISFLRATISFEFGRYQDAHSKVTELEKECDKRSIDKLCLEFLILKTNILIYTGSFKDSLNLIVELERKLESLYDTNSIEYKNYKVTLLKMKGVCFRATGELSLVEQTLRKGLELSRLINNKFETAEILDRLSMSLSNDPDRFAEALDSVNESLSIRKEIGNANYIAQTLNRLGILSRENGRPKEALKLYHEALEYAVQLDNKDLISIIRSNIGGINDSFGDLNKAIENYAISLKLSQETNNKNMISLCYLNIANIYRNRGELDTALENFNLALKYLEEQGYQAPIATCLSQIGLIYYSKGDYKKASEYVLRSIKLSEEENRKKAISTNLYNLILISLDNNMLDKAKEYFDELEKIKNELSIKSIDQRYKIAEALILMTSTRFQNRAKAEGLLKEVINDETTSHEIVEKALLTLCDLLLDELKITGSIEVLDEIQVYVAKLESIARNQHSYLLLTQTYWLQSQLALISLDLNKAKKLLIQAQIIAEEKQLHRLVLKINNEYETLLNQAKQWARLKDESATFDKRISMIQIDDLIASMTSNKEIEMLDFSLENPVYLIIISKSGKTLFTRKFHTLSTLDDALIGGFIAAINSFASEIFETTGHIERIKHQNYTLIIKVEGDFLFSYVYKGQSFTALSKLTNYVEKVSSIKFLWNKLEEVSKTPIYLDDSFKIELERRADSIFAA